MHAVSQENKLSENKEEENTALILKAAHYYQERRINKHAVDDIALERMNKVIKEHISKDMKQYKECKELKVELELKDSKLKNKGRECLLQCR